MFALMVHPWPHCVVALYTSLAEAEEAIRDLDLGEFPLRQVSLISRTPEEEGLILSGSLARALFDSMEELVRGAGAGGFLRGLLAWGVSAADVGRYEALLRAGTSLVVSHGTAHQARKAQRLLSTNGALAVRTHGSPTGLPETPGCAQACRKRRRISGQLVRATDPRCPERDNSW